ncbi:MAG: TonB-dependent receptor plug domain-containing protein [Saprospiraceae bacterium]|nr:TonB-dependent receptor plug domain-containing protein [Saprospiraceae bacterium]
MKRLLTLFLFMGLTFLVQAQKMVSGTVTDVPASVSVLVLSYAGYNSKEVSVSGMTANMSITLSEGKLLEEVVVVGYGIQRKADLTGSVASIKGADIAIAPVQSFDQALQGRAAGVQITTPNGVLNNPPVIRVRGTNSINLNSQPLIVIDGVPTYSGDLSVNSAANNPLANINPADIESFEILKDASASAIYGSRAAAGVILITTKKGKKGSTRVSYDGWVGQTEALRLFDMLNASQYLEVKNEALANANNAARYIGGQDVNGNPIDTRWYDQTHQKGFSHNHNLNFSGGNDATTYYLSVGYTEQEGFLKGSSFDRTSSRLNLDHQLMKNVKVGTNISYANTVNAGPNSGSIPEFTMEPTLAATLLPGIPLDGD